MQRRYRYGKRTVSFAPRKVAAAVRYAPTEPTRNTKGPRRTGSIVDALDAAASESKVPRTQPEATDAKEQDQTQNDSDASQTSGMSRPLAFMKNASRYFASERAHLIPSAVPDVAGGQAVNAEAQTHALEALCSSSKFYSHIHASGSTRMHLGDVHTSITNNNQICVSGVAGSLTLLPTFQEGGTVSRQELAVAFLATMALNAAVESVLVKTISCILFLLKLATSRRSVPMQINFFSATFEDAFGRRMTFEIGGMINDWQIFHQVVTSNHQNRPGHRRVANAQYRLFDGSGSGVLVNPRHPPEFAAVFRHSAIIHMSILFKATEVSDQQCPKCGLEQTCRPNTDTPCAGPQCNFVHRGQVEDFAIEVVGVDFSTLSKNADTGRVSARKDVKDDPAQFSRISISKKPYVLREHRQHCIACHTRQAYGDQTRCETPNCFLEDYIPAGHHWLIDTGQSNESQGGYLSGSRRMEMHQTRDREELLTRGFSDALRFEDMPSRMPAYGAFR